HGVLAPSRPPHGKHLHRPAPAAASFGARDARVRPLYRPHPQPVRRNGPHQGGRMKSGLNNLGMGAAGTLSLIVVFVIWEALCRRLVVQVIMLPLPSTIFSELWADLPWYLSLSLYTLWTTVAGFVLSVVGGVLIAVCLVGSRLFERFLHP